MKNHCMHPLSLNHNHSIARRERWEMEHKALRRTSYTTRGCFLSLSLSFCLPPPWCIVSQRPLFRGTGSIWERQRCSWHLAGIQFNIDPALFSAGKQLCTLINALALLAQSNLESFSSGSLVSRLIVDYRSRTVCDVYNIIFFHGSRTANSILPLKSIDESITENRNDSCNCISFEMSMKYPCINNSGVRVK